MTPTDKNDTPLDVLDALDTASFEQKGLDGPTERLFVLEVTVTKGMGEGLTLTSRKLPAIIGRGTTVEFSVPDDPSNPTLSRHHALLDSDGERITVEDLSTNGTWVGGVRLVRGDSQRIASGETIGLGPNTSILVKVAPLDLELDAPERVERNPSWPPSSVIEGVADAAASRRSPVDGTVEVPCDEGVLETPRHALRLNVLGAVQVGVQSVDMAPSSWGARKAVILLAALLEFGGRGINVGRLLEVLWPESPDTSRSAMQTLVSRVRRAFSQTDLSWPDPIVHENGIYRINPLYRVEYDVREFQVACEHAKHLRVTAADDEFDAALTRAVALYGGPFLEGYEDEWVAARRRALETVYFEAVEALAELRQRSGRYAEAVHLLSAVLDREPCRETSMNLTLTGLAAMGRRDEALRRYHAFVRTLERTYGVTPSLEMRRVYDALRGG